MDFSQQLRLLLWCLYSCYLSDLLLPAHLPVFLSPANISAFSWDSPGCYSNPTRGSKGALSTLHPSSSGLTGRDADRQTCCGQVCIIIIIIITAEMSPWRPACTWACHRGCQGVLPRLADAGVVDYLLTYTISSASCIMDFSPLLCSPLPCCRS